MDAVAKKQQRRERATARRQLGQRAAIGLEAEFAVMLDGEQVKPEDVFGSPRAIVRGPLMHRVGRSYHLPTGGAVYFDTGVVEIATPMIELAPGCAARAGRSLWESIRFLREELDDWERRDGRSVQLAGFSAHYNVSFDVPAEEQRAGRTVHDLAVLLTYLLPFPVMLLAANRESTGIGVRPRGNRIEITADFTPDPALMIAAATLIVGVVREVMTWPSYELRELDARDVPVPGQFAPIPHSSRKGWVAKYTCFPANPFQSDVDVPLWDTRRGERLSLREIAGRTTRYFSRSIRQFADPVSLRLIGSVMRGRAPSLLELAERPAAYCDVGRLCTWGDLFPEHMLPRSEYEQVLLYAVQRQPLWVDDDWAEPTGVRGWTQVVFRRRGDGSRRVYSLDDLLAYLRDWGTGRGARAGRTRRRTVPSRAAARRAAR
ncbi:hypothetical protein J421_3672 [Gemmatirosa kalamazoonensis]|uniref:Uncharacterized protein n=1 Tax=Gemmatirosa kalamazoonensis TaxID=861299 RepID=W0RJG4_9BACT|nr:hypothetical protein [Gemmatirosa kalamazoonensis]AHG91209.1 hypothetical protein J421_3672 [Gemmatirosa kalamazoonensis]